MMTVLHRPAPMGENAQILSKGTHALVRMVFSEIPASLASENVSQELVQMGACASMKLQEPSVFAHPISMDPIAHFVCFSIFDFSRPNYEFNNEQQKQNDNKEYCQNGYRTDSQNFNSSQGVYARYFDLTSVSNFHSISHLLLAV